jgi:hypothetical protein
MKTDFESEQLASHIVIYNKNGLPQDCCLNISAFLNNYISY